jgi:hypothetical protein
VDYYSLLSIVILGVSCVIVATILKWRWRYRRALSYEEEAQAVGTVDHANDMTHSAIRLSDEEEVAVVNTIFPGAMTARSRIVRIACEGVRSKLGVEAVKPGCQASRNAIAREIRRWATDHKMRPSHIDPLVPLVLAVYFIPTPAALEAAALEASAAYAEALAGVHRISWYGSFWEKFGWLMFPWRTHLQ